MKYLSPKKGFLGIDAEQTIAPQVIVVPFGLEKTVSYGGGTKYAPKEIIKASHQVELFDEELNKETFRYIGIKTLEPFKIKNQIKSALTQLADINEKIISNFLVVLKSSNLDGCRSTLLIFKNSCVSFPIFTRYGFISTPSTCFKNFDKCKTRKPQLHPMSSATFSVVKYFLISYLSSLCSVGRHPGNFISSNP